MNRATASLNLAHLLGPSALSLVLVVACGGSDEKDKDKEGSGGAATGGSTGAGGSTSGGAPGSGGAAPLLGPDTAGKACSQPSDCAPSGTCAGQLTAGAFGSLLGASLVTSGGYCTAACVVDAECGEGGVCFGAIAPIPGECRSSCEADADCREGHECASGAPITLGDAGGTFTLPKTCQPKPTVDQLTDEAGKACGGDAGNTCGQGTCLDGPGFPGGYCTGSCVTDAECGSGALCLRGYYGSQGACWEACTVDADCARDADGYGCADRGGKRVCVAKQDPLPAGVLGTACSGDGDCSPGACATTLPSNDIAAPTLPAPGGYCTLAEPCADSEACGPGGVCTLTLAGLVCMKGCTTAADCGRTGYTCDSRGALPLGSTATVCAPIPVDGGTPLGDGGTTPDASTSSDASAGD